MSTALEFPIAIALVGAPDSGKQAVAEAYKDLSASWFEEQTVKGLNVIPNGGNAILEDLNQAVGLFGGWKEDLRIFMRRYEQEQAYLYAKQNFITLGTALDNMAHTGVNMENILRGIQTEQQQQQLQVQQIAMTQLTYLFLSTFRYSFAFYIPKTAGLILPGANDDEANYNNRLDDALQMIFQNFGIRLQRLDQPTVEERAAFMHQTITDIAENGVQEITEIAQVEEDESLLLDASATLSE